MMHLHRDKPIKSFYATPMGLIFIPLTIFSAVFWTWLCISAYEERDFFYTAVFIVFDVIYIFFGIYIFPYTCCKIEIYDNYIISKAPLFKPIRIDYAKCNTWVDYHIQSGHKIWWICFSYGDIPKFHTNSRNRINSMKTKEGFIRLMYNKEIADAILPLLPKQQYNSLSTSIRCARLD